MKMTVLEMVQDILSALEADDVNSISDTPEGYMVARVIRRVYLENVGQWSTPNLVSAFFTLDGLGDVTRPTYLSIPEDIDEVYWLRYDVKESGDTTATYRQLTYMEPNEFFDRLAKRNLADSNVSAFNSTDGVPLYILTDTGPSFYTVVENKYAVCDAYDSAVDTTLQSSKTVAGGRKSPTFTLDDDYTPDLDAQLFPHLLAEALAICFVELKQSQNAKAESSSRRQAVRIQNNKHRFGDKQSKVNNFHASGPNFGRRR